MITKQATLPELADLQQIIKHQIVERTLGRIRVLEVEVTEKLLIVRGWAESYHLKQLAIRGVLDVIGRSGPRPIDIDVRIAVGPPGPNANIAGGWK